MGWSDRASAPPAVEAVTGRERQGAHISTERSNSRRRSSDIWLCAPLWWPRQAAAVARTHLHPCLCQPLCTCRQSCTVRRRKNGKSFAGPAFSVPGRTADAPSPSATCAALAGEPHAAPVAERMTALDPNESRGNGRRCATSAVSAVRRRAVRCFLPRSPRRGRRPQAVSSTRPRSWLLLEETLRGRVFLPAP